jgi:hypothetical protein
VGRQVAADLEVKGLDEDLISDRELREFGRYGNPGVPNRA